MQGITELVKEKAKELLSSGKAQRVLGWQKGEFMYDQTPQSFSKVEELDNFVYDGFSAPNLSKYLISESQKEGVTAVFLKPCDTTASISFSKNSASSAKTFTSWAFSATASLITKS